MADEKMYRTAFVVSNTGHDFSELLKSVERIQFIMTGYEPENEALDTLVSGMTGYDPERDVIVPVGNVTQNLLLGVILARVLATYKNFTMAVFYEKSYHFKTVTLTGIYPSLSIGALFNGKSE